MELLSIILFSSNLVVLTLISKYLKIIHSKYLLPRAKPDVDIFASRKF